jgi:hypothetical protein
MRSPFLDNDLLNLLFQAPANGFDGSGFERDCIKRSRNELMGIRTNKGTGGSSSPLISKIAQVVIRTRALSEKALSWEAVPHALHHVVTRLDSLVLSPLQLTRLVVGFEYFRHYNLWFRRELAPYLKEILLDQRTLSRPYWNPMGLTKLVNDHINGRGRYLAEIRKVLTIELILRTLIEGNE